MIMLGPILDISLKVRPVVQRRPGRTAHVQAGGVRPAKHRARQPRHRGRRQIQGEVSIQSLTDITQSTYID